MREFDWDGLLYLLMAGLITAGVDLARRWGQRLIDNATDNDDDEEEED